MKYSATATAAKTADVLLAMGTGPVGPALAALCKGPGTLHLLVPSPWPAGPQQTVQLVNPEQLPPLPPAAMAFCCLGTTLKVNNAPAAFRAVQQPAVMAFARAARAAGVQRLGVLSAQGADPRARYFFHRLKGELEAELALLGFASLVLARPGLMADAAGAPARPGLGGRLAQAAAAPLRPLRPLLPAAWRPLAAPTVARALLQAVAAGPRGVLVLEPPALLLWGAETRGG